MKIQEFIMKVLAISKIGKRYSHDPYALENYEELENLAIEQLSNLVNEEIDTNPYDRDLYPTVNCSVRTIVTNEHNQVLMVKEKSEQLWSFPGGWADVFESPQENAKKEVYQESGYDVDITRLLAVFFRDNYKPADFLLVSEYVLYFHGVVKERLKNFNHEIVDIGFFEMNDLPPLSTKNSQIEVERALACLNQNQTTFD